MATSVGFQGERGAFSEEAAYALFADDLSVACGYDDFDALVAGVEKGEVHYGLLPCENTIYGSIARAYDLLLEHAGVAIVDETVHRIEQCLIGTEKAKVAEVEQVLSHPVALEQCRRFLKQRGLRVVVVADTAGAVREVVAKNDARVAAIGPRFAVVQYGGSVLAESIQDETENVTRFFVISRNPGARRNLGRLCLAFVLPHRSGSLYEALGAVAGRGLNLRSLIARPRLGRPFEYVFYAELDCPAEIDAAALARTISPESRVLGRY